MDKFDITVPMWQWVTSQGIFLVTLSILVYALSVKCKTRTLAFLAIGCFTYAIAFGFLEDFVMTGVMSMATLRNGVYAYLEYRRRKLDAESTEAKRKEQRLSIIVFLILFTLTAGTLVTINVVLDSWWYDWVLVAVSLFAAFGSWAKGVHLVRISSFTLAIAIIKNNIFYFNLVGILLESIVAVTIVLFYVRYLYVKHMEKTTFPCNRQN